MGDLKLCVEASTLKNIAFISDPKNNRPTWNQIPSVLHLLEILILADEIVYNAMSSKPVREKTLDLIDSVPLKKNDEDLLIKKDPLDDVVCEMIATKAARKFISYWNSTFKTDPISAKLANVRQYMPAVDPYPFLESWQEFLSVVDSDKECEKWVKNNCYMETERGRMFDDGRAFLYGVSRQEHAREGVFNLSKHSASLFQDIDFLRSFNVHFRVIYNADMALHRQNEMAEPKLICYMYSPSVARESLYQSYLEHPLQSVRNTLKDAMHFSFRDQKLLNSIINAWESALPLPFLGIFVLKEIKDCRGLEEIYGIIQKVREEDDIRYIRSKLLESELAYYSDVESGCKKSSKIINDLGKFLLDGICRKHGVKIESKPSKVRDFSKLALDASKKGVGELFGPIWDSAHNAYIYRGDKCAYLSKLLSRFKRDNNIKKIVSEIFDIEDN